MSDRSDPSVPSAASSETLRVGLLGPVQSLDPWGKQDFESTMVLSHVFEPPFAQPEGDRDPEPLLLAERLRPEPGEGPGACSAAVRDDVRFSDGTPLTPELLVESLARSTVLRRIVDLEVKEGRVVFRPSRPGVRLDLVLGQRYCGVVLVRDGELLGTGPYRLDPASTPEHTRLVRNAEHRERPAIEVVELVAYPPNAKGEPEELLEAVERGDVDFCNVVSREAIDRLRSVRKWLEPGSGTAILYFNTTSPALADPKVREALAQGIDRGEVAKTCYPNPVAFTATGLLPPMMGSFRDGIACDSKQAVARLRQLDGERPRRLSMLLIHGPRPYLPQPRAVADNLTEQLGKLGIEVEVREAATLEGYFREAARGEYDLALSGWLADSMDPVDFLDTILGPESVPGDDRRHVIDGNLSHWRSDEIKQALERFAEDPSERSKQAILEILRRETPNLPLLYGPTIYVYSPKVAGFKPSPLGIPEFGKMSLLD